MEFKDSIRKDMVFVLFVVTGSCTYGYPAKNIPNDLQCEHLNGLCKTAVNGLWANKMQHCIIRVAKVIGVLSTMLDNIDSDNEAKPFPLPTRCPRKKKRKKEREKKTGQALRLIFLLKTAVLSTYPRRCHPSFTKPGVSLELKKEIFDWMEQCIHF